MVLSRQKFVTWSGTGLAHTRVHIWHASLEQPLEVVQKLESVLSEEERQRAEKFRLQEHRQSFIVSRGILRNILYRYTKIRPEQIRFKYNLAGKPFLADETAVSDLYFNLSHSGLLALYAFTWGRQVGIDVEAIHPSEDMDQIARQNFSPSEYRKFTRLSGVTRLRAFYNCWTRKEAFIKAVGDGFSFPLQRFEVSFAPGEPADLISVDGSMEAAQSWSMHDIKTWDGYAAAFVVEGRDYSISHKQWTYTSTAPK